MDGVILKKLSKVPTDHIIKQYWDNRVNDKFMDMGLVVPVFWSTILVGIWTK
jgi:hypothetical protein